MPDNRFRASKPLPSGWHFIKASPEVDHDGLAAMALDYASEHARARHPDSPGGIEIADCEAETLGGKATALKAV